MSTLQTKPNGSSWHCQRHRDSEQSDERRNIQKGSLGNQGFIKLAKHSETQHWPATPAQDCCKHKTGQNWMFHFWEPCRIYGSSSVKLDILQDFKKGSKKKRESSSLVLYLNYSEWSTERELQISEWHIYTNNEDKWSPSKLLMSDNHHYW